MKPPETAMIFCAGLGSRARPLTDGLHKGLFPVLNRPVLGYALERLKAAGVVRLVANTHHLAGQVEEFLRANWGQELLISREPDLLGTGGGLLKAAVHLAGGPFYLLNCDVFTDLDLAALARRHHETQALATLALVKAPAFASVAVDGGGRVVSLTRRGGLGLWTFSGAQVLEPGFFRYLKPGFSSTPQAFERAIAAGERVMSFRATGAVWQDLGTLENYLALHHRLLKGRMNGPALVLGAGARLEKGARVEDWAVLGAGARLMEGAVARRAVVWENALVEPGVRVEGAVVARGAVARQDVSGRAVTA